MVCLKNRTRIVALTSSPNNWTRMWLGQAIGFGVLLDRKRSHKIKLIRSLPSLGRTVVDRYHHTMVKDITFMILDMVMTQKARMTYSTIHILH